MDLGGVEPTSVRGAFFRHIPAGGEPLFSPEHSSDGRWQRGSVVEGFYLAGDERTVWAEWYRALADLSSDERLLAVGLPPLLPDRSQWGEFQAAGETLAEAGWPGILYPSAARSEGAVALCVFRREERTAGVVPVGSPARHKEPAPPTGLRT